MHAAIPKNISENSKTKYTYLACIVWVNWTMISAFDYVVAI